MKRGTCKESGAQRTFRTQCPRGDLTRWSTNDFDRYERLAGVDVLVPAEKATAAQPVTVPPTSKVRSGMSAPIFEGGRAA